MSKQSNTPKSEAKQGGKLLFTKENYILMLASVAVVVIGFALMTGKEDIYAPTKITLAPITVLIGYVIGVFAIFYRKK